MSGNGTLHRSATSIASWWYHTTNQRCKANPQFGCTQEEKRRIGHAALDSTAGSIGPQSRLTLNDLRRLFGLAQHGLANAFNRPLAAMMGGTQ